MPERTRQQALASIQAAITAQPANQPRRRLMMMPGNGHIGNQTIILSGDATGSGTTAIPVTLTANSVDTSNIIASNVTYPKIQNVAAARLLGNPTGGAAAPSEISLGTGLSFTGTVLNGTGGSGTVTSIAAGAGITVSPSPITGAGTVSLTVPVSVANGGTGTTTAFTTGSVLFAGASGVYAQDNANLFWDDTNNRLGIGTASPGVALDVAGPGRIAGTGASASGAGLEFLYNSAGPVGTVQCFDRTGAAYRPLAIGGSTIAIGAAGASDIFVNAAHNVGIGTPSPVTRLNVLGADGTPVLNGDPGILTITGGSTVQAQFGTYAGTPFAVWLQIKAAGQNAAYPLALQPLGGNVGIGTASPGSRLHVYEGSGARTPVILVGQGLAGGQVVGRIEFNTTGNGTLYLSSVAPGVGHGNTILQPDGGNVGIGTASPGSRLEVNGDIRMPTNMSVWYGASQIAETSSTLLLLAPTASWYRSPSIAFQNAAGSASYAIFDATNTRNNSGAWAVISERGLKENVQPYTRGLAAIIALNPVQFTYAPGTPFAVEAADQLRMGLIADEVQPYVPEIVSSTEVTVRGAAMTVDTLEPGNLIYALINSVKELSARLEAAEAKL